MMSPTSLEIPDDPACPFSPRVISAHHRVKIWNLPGEFTAGLSSTLEAWNLKKEAGGYSGTVPGYPPVVLALPLPRERQRNKRRSSSNGTTMLREGYRPVWWAGPAAACGPWLILPARTQYILYERELKYARARGPGRHHHRTVCIRGFQKALALGRSGSPVSDPTPAPPWEHHHREALLENALPPAWRQAVVPTGVHDERDCVPRGFFEKL